MRATVARRLLTHGLFFGLSILFATRVFSLAHPGSHWLPDGDPALMCWTMQWVSHTLVHDPQHLFSGNTFFPYAHAIVLTDPMITLAVLNLPVRLFTANPWVGYNLLIVAAYYLSCVWGSALARRITGSEAAAVWGGLFWGFLFFRMHHIGHLQILSFQFMPAAVLAWLRLRERPGTRTALLFALACVAQALVSWYLAVMLAVVLVIVAIGRPETAAPVPALSTSARYYLLAAVVMAALMLPVAVPYAKGFTDSTLADRQALVDTFGDAVGWRDYLTPPVSTLLGRRIAGNPYWIWGENTLYVGIVPLALAMAGVVAVARRRVSRRWGAIGLALVTSGFVLALGFVSPRLGVPLPLHYLARVVPLLAGLRATQRFSLVLYMGVLVLSSLGLAQVLRARRPRWQGLGTGVVAAAFLLEVFPVGLPVATGYVYEVSAPDRFIAELQRTRPEPLVVLHLPINYFTQGAYPVAEATYMIDSTAHWARILNGFSGGVPADFMPRMETLNTLPSVPAVNVLLRLGVDVVALHGSAAGGGPGSVVEFFERQPWAAVTRLPNGEAVVVIDKVRAPFEIHAIHAARP